MNRTVSYRWSLGLASVLLLVSACSPDSQPLLSTPAATPAAPATATAPTVAASPTLPATRTAIPSPRPSVTATTSAAPEILIQREAEESPGNRWNPGGGYPYGRLPAFTLFADGTVIYADYARHQAMRIRLSPQGTQALVEQILALGFERLESYSGNCRQNAQGAPACIGDVGPTTLRVRLPSGVLREVSITGGAYFPALANDPQAFKAIDSLLAGYRNPAAQPYKPERATLFILSQDTPLFFVPTGAPVQDWPLDPAWLVLPASGPNGRAVTESARVLAGTDLDKFLATVRGNMGDFYFRHAGRVYDAYLVPWLPGVDYTAQVARYGQPDTSTPPAPTPSP